jgi:alpha-mannosidase
MKKVRIKLLLAAGLMSVAVSSLLAYNIAGGEHCNFEVAVAHLDTHWQWTRTTTYNTYIPNTLHNNFTLFRSYPRYKFSFCGAFRYWIAEQYGQLSHGTTSFANYDWDTLKKYIANGQWCLAGSWIDEIDPNMPCVEAMCRSFLYGQGYYIDKFNKRSFDIYLPDCFGFSYSLPTLANHFGVRGFSTQKFDLWGGWFAVAAARSVMKWTGPDGTHIFCAMKPSAYSGSYEANTTNGNAVYTQTGNRLWVAYDYYGVGDVGGAPATSDVSGILGLAGGQLNGAYCFPAASDSLFRILDSLERNSDPGVAALANYDGELVMQTHGTGCYTSRCDVKVRYRGMELAGLSCEPAATIAHRLAGTAYPKDQLWRAWFKGIDHAFHDDLTGTSILTAYTNPWDGTIADLDSQITNFNTLRTSANNSVAGILNTTVAGAGAVPVVVFNPIGQERRDVVQATVTFAAATTYVKVLDPTGTEVPSQVISGGGTATPTILFIAAAPSAGYAVYEVQPATSYTGPATGVSVNGTAWTMDNDYYTATIDATGDISQIVNKKDGNRNLFTSASRWQLRPDNSSSWPQWEVTRANVQAAVSSYVGSAGTVTRTVVESGPVRVTIRVNRTHLSSTYSHYYRLCADSAGKRIVVDDSVNWVAASRGNLLKAGFFLAASNDSATYSVGVGTIKRPNYNIDNRYEVLSQQWGALDNSDGTFGVAVLNHYKYGWSKPANNTLNLTLIHSTSSTNYQCDGDIRLHYFSYGIYAYTGNWRNGVENQAQQFNLPLVGYQTTAHAATGNGVSLPNNGKTYSLVRVSDPTKVQIMAVKKAERGDTTGGNKYIVRIREIAAGSSTVNLIFGNQVTAALSTNGMEDDAGTVPATLVTANEISFPVTKYQLKTLKVTLTNAVGVQWRKGPDGGVPSFDDLAFKLLFSNGSRQYTAKLLFNASEKVRRVYVTNMAGRLVRSLHDGSVPLDASSRIVWDGRDNIGNAVPNGVYVVNVVTDRQQKQAVLHAIK